MKAKSRDIKTDTKTVSPFASERGRSTRIGSTIKKSQKPQLNRKLRKKLSKPAEPKESIIKMASGSNDKHSQIIYELHPLRQFIAYCVCDYLKLGRHGTSKPVRINKPLFNNAVKAHVALMANQILPHDPRILVFDYLNMVEKINKIDLPIYSIPVRSRAILYSFEHRRIVEALRVSNNTIDEIVTLIKSRKELWGVNRGDVSYYLEYFWNLGDDGRINMLIADYIISIRNKLRENRGVRGGSWKIIDHSSGNEITWDTLVGVSDSEPLSSYNTALVAASGKFTSSEILMKLNLPEYSILKFEDMLRQAAIKTMGQLFVSSERGEVYNTTRLSNILKSMTQISKALRVPIIEAQSGIQSKTKIQSKSPEEFGLDKSEAVQPTEPEEIESSAEIKLTEFDNANKKR